jgi:hypothetical protein
MKRTIILCVLCTVYIAAGCATKDATVSPEPIITTTDVNVAVQVPCIKKQEEVDSKRPVFPDTPAALAAADNIYEAIKLYKAGQKIRLGWEGVLESALNACVDASAPETK